MLNDIERSEPPRKKALNPLPIVDTRERKKIGLSQQEDKPQL